MYFEETVNGPVSAVTYRLTGGYMRVDSCTYTGNKVHCEGWINGGDATVILIVDWREPCPPTDEDDDPPKKR